MENKTLVTFGDSWAQGSELSAQEKTFGKIVADILGCKQFKNYAQPASSINHLLIQLKSFLHMLSHSHIADPSDCIAIFFLTEPGRTFTVVDSSTVFLNPDGGFGLPRDKDLENTINKNYWKYVHSDTTSILTANSTVYNLQNLCKHYSICDYYIQGWTEFEFWPEIVTDKIYKQGKVTCADLIQDNRAIGGHPNQRGHELIANELIDWIRSDAK